MQQNLIAQSNHFCIFIVHRLNHSDMKNEPRLLILLFLFFSLNVTSQSERFSVGVGFSPDYYSFNFREDLFTNSGHYYDTRFNFSSGLFFNYQIIDQLGIRFGGQYTSKSYEINYKWNASLGNNGWGNPDVPLKTIFSHRYFDIPFNVYLSIIRREKIRVSPTFGFHYSFRESSFERSDMGDGGEVSSTFLKTVLVYDVLQWKRLGIYVDWKLTDKMYLSFEPYYQLEVPKTSQEKLPKSNSDQVNNQGNINQSSNSFIREKQ